jgi:cell wall-associated NlpC family hydrolase
VLALSATGLVAGGLLGSLAVASPATAATAPAAVHAALTMPAAVQAAAPARVATRVSISVSRTSTTTYDPLGIWGRVSYGTASFLRGETVVLQQYVGPGWRNVAWAKANNSGYVDYTVYPSSSLTYRLYYSGAPSSAPSASATRSIQVSAASRASRVVAIAASKSGDWYRFGAAGPSQFDCSGLTEYVFKQVGVSLPHFADSQKRYGVAVSWAQARPGDLVVFLSGGYGYHVGIYAGGGYMYDAPHEGATVGRHKIYGSNVVFRRLV